MHMRRASQIRAMLVLGLLMTCKALPAPSPGPDRLLGKFPWDTTTAEVRLQQPQYDKGPATDEIAVAVAIDTETTMGGVTRRTRPVPTGAMQVWLLSEDGTALRQLPRQPPPGSPAIKFGNAGTLTSVVHFKFKLPAGPSIAAAVVQLEGKIYVFPIDKPPFKK